MSLLQGEKSTSLTSPGEAPSQTPQQEHQLEMGSSTPSSVFQNVFSPFEPSGPSGSGAAAQQQATPSAGVIFTPSAISSPIFSPGALLSTAMMPQAQETVGGPLPSEKYIRPTIYSPLNITTATSEPRFSPLKVPSQPAGSSSNNNAAQAGKGSRVVAPLTPGSEKEQSEDESTSSSDEEGDHPTASFTSPLVELVVLSFPHALWFSFFFRTFFLSTEF